ncbi:MAG: hypothetical protein ABJB85_03300 [Nitrososphaerota archaeon]
MSRSKTLSGGVTYVNSPDKVIFIGSVQLRNFQHAVFKFHDIRQYPHAFLVDVD